jgi:DNA-binding Lrp family transcriptional regulator
MTTENETISLDATDLRLLDALQRDAGLSNLALAERLAVSPATCLRRTRRLESWGLIEQRLAVLNPQRLALALGHGLTAVIEVTLERQDEATLASFEARAVAEPTVQQCYRVSPGPDFVLVTHCADMPAHLAMGQRLFTADSSVRNVKAFFSTKRSKFAPHLPLTPLGR